jgi:aryl-phospho-beta-D-glucosidase BglC (GH1 family)
MKHQWSLWFRTARLVLAATTAMMLPALSSALFTTPGVEARVSHDLPSPSAFALSASTFPPGSIVRGGRATERTLEAASSLHTVPFTKLGHLLGYLETAWWWPSTQSGGRGQLASIQYMASVFSSPDGANSAFTDAQASLWELGYSLSGKVANSRLFTVTARDGHGNAYLLLHRGSIELEFRLQYDRSIDRQALQAGLRYLLRTGHAAWERAGRISRSLTAGTAPAAPNLLPAISVAPWGAGPIVKSPSLMVLDESQDGPDTHLDPGAFRPPSDQPTLATRTALHPRLVPPPGLSRYVRTASSSRGGGWYEATTLYQSPGEAHNALLALSHANRYHSWLPAYPLNPEVWHVGSLGLVDESRAWRLHGETIFVFRVQNVLLTLASLGQAPNDAAILVTALIKTIPTPLHAEGTTIMTAAGDPVRLASVNWYGAEEQDFVLGGLDFQPYQAILQKIRALGFNSIRLPISNQLVEENPIVSAHVAANPELQGLHALDILDHIINYAGALGISIILDDHRSDAGWSTQPDGLWYTTMYPEAAFNRDWATVAQRYALNTTVIGADLRNEPHGKVSWGDGNVLTDWHAAAQRAGNAVLAANPHLLVIVEGVQYYKNAPSYWWGGSLMGVQDDPVVLHFADGSSARSQLEYSVHDYGPRLCGSGCPWFNKDTTYASLSKIWEQYWGYVVDDPKQAYAAPIWVGEFGTCDYQQSCVIDTAPGSQGEWFSSLVQYIAEKHLSWGYWAVNGTESTGGSRVYGTFDWYGFLDHTWTAPYPWLEEGLSKILVPSPNDVAQGNQGLQGGWAVDNKGGISFIHSLTSQYGWFQQAGAGWVRINFRLGSCFTNWTSLGCNGKTALATYDQVVQNALDSKLHILGLLSNESWPGKQADWTAGNAENTGGNGDNPYIDSFARQAAGILAAHFSSNVSQWEVWNEPNAWTSSPTPGTFTGGSFIYPSNFAWLLTRCYQAVKAANATATVISGGLLSQDTDSGSAYLSSTYDMGAKDAGWIAGATPFDGVGQHLYIDPSSTTSANTVSAPLETLRRTYLAYEGTRTNKLTYVTEVGWSTASVSAAVQALNLQTAYTTFQKTRYIGRAYWLSVQDVPEAGLFYGLVDTNGVQKPAFAAYQQYATY